MAFEDRLLGNFEEVVDDFVVRRNDGTPAYQLAVVVDDAAQGIGEVVRGADLADSTPRQILLARLLGLPEPTYAHVPLVLGPDGRRLAKRHGAVTLSDQDEGPNEVRAWMARTLGLAGVGEIPSLDDLISRFEPDLLGGVTALTFRDEAVAPEPVWENRLYRTVSAHPGDQRAEAVELKAVPFYAWANREPGAMRVWLQSR